VTKQNQKKERAFFLLYQPSKHQGEPKKVHIPQKSLLSSFETLLPPCHQRNATTVIKSWAHSQAIRQLQKFPKEEKGIVKKESHRDK